VPTDSMRDKLMEAAASVIRERGLAGTTIRMISKAAGVAEGSVYNHFTGKHELISAVFVERMPRILLKDAIGKLLSSVGQGTVIGNLEALAQDAVVAYRELDAIAAMLISDPETAATLRQDLAERRLGPARGLEAVAAYVKIEEAQGRVVLPAAPMILVAALLGGCHEYAFQQLFHDESPFGDDLGAFAGRLVGALFRAPGDPAVAPR
jgi:AcrR family transcriptional regulator